MFSFFKKIINPFINIVTNIFFTELTLRCLSAKKMRIRRNKIIQLHMI